MTKRRRLIEPSATNSEGVEVLLPMMGVRDLLHMQYRDLAKLIATDKFARPDFYAGAAMPLWRRQTVAQWYNTQQEAAQR
jgi:hypothetical protein